MSELQKGETGKEGGLSRRAVGIDLDEDVVLPEEEPQQTLDLTNISNLTIEPTNNTNDDQPNPVITVTEQQEIWGERTLQLMGVPSPKSQKRLRDGVVKVGSHVMKNVTKHKERAESLLLEVGNYGPPPWNTQTSMRMSAVKMELDLLSIPEGEIKMKKLNSTSVNEVFVVGSGSGTTPSFACKPKSKKVSVSGVPPGGDVPREALACRAGQFLANQLGIGLDVPETHIIELDLPLLQGISKQEGKKTPCSVQEWRPNLGSMMGMSIETKRKIKQEQLVGVLMLDTITLNTDRHAGNMLLGESGEVVPIDLGASFLEPAPDITKKTGCDRIMSTIGGPHNVLIGIPSLHDDIPEQTLKQLKGFSASAFKKHMLNECKALTKLTGEGMLEEEKQPQGEQPTDMQIKGNDEKEQRKPLITNEALELSYRASRFFELAINNKPPLSPAAIQVALGGAASRLFAFKDGEFEVKDQRIGSDFDKLCKKIIKKTVANKETIKDICLSSDREFNALAQAATDLGWTVACRNQPVADGCLTDPVILAVIVGKGIHGPLDPENMQKVYEFTDSPKTSGQVTQFLLAAKYNAGKGVLVYVDPKESEELAQKLNIAKETENSAELSKAVNALSERAVDYQLRRLRELAEKGKSKELSTGTRLEFETNLGLLEKALAEPSLKYARDNINTWARVVGVELDLK